MAELEFKNLKEAAAHAAEQDKQIAELKESVNALQQSQKEGEAPVKELGADITLKVEGKEYKVAPAAKFRLPGKTVTGADLAKDSELAAKLVKAGVKQIKKA